MEVLNIVSVHWQEEIVSKHKTLLREKQVKACSSFISNRLYVFEHQKAMLSSYLEDDDLVWTIGPDSFNFSMRNTKHDGRKLCKIPHDSRDYATFDFNSEWYTVLWYPVFHVE